MRLFVAVLLLLLAATGCFAQRTAARDVLSVIKNDDAGEAIHHLYDSPSWELILRGISSGDAEWLGVYRLLKPVSDAHASEELEAALQDAMIEKPFQVIPLYEQSGYTPQQLCDFHFEVDCPREGIERYLRRLEMNLSDPQGDKQRAIRRECQKGIATTLARFKDRPNYCELGA